MIFKKKKTANDSPKINKAKNNKNPSKKEKKPDFKKQPMLIKFFYMVFYFGLGSFLVVCLGLWLYAEELSHQYQLEEKALDGVLWELPSHVYARPLELYVGKTLKLEKLQQELNYLDYKRSAALRQAGTYHIEGNEVLIYKRAFGFWDARESEQLIRVTIKDNRISHILDMNTLNIVPITRLEPLKVGAIYPKHGQDRVLIGLDQTPSILVDTIIATEDRRFYSHPGIDAKGLARAILQGIKQGRISQGASTLTQQFVKNHYLTSERRISRKVKEALIALILESNYSKKQILEGYLNEIFLGQDGSRAIHGFGLAAEHYFGKPLKDLGVHQIATLVALVREPGRANPYKNPKYAKKRRALILNVMVSQGLIAKKDADIANSLPLDVLAKSERKKQDKYYAFLQLVYQQLAKEYDRKSLSSGLNVFTTLDPMIQNEAEKSAADALTVLEKRKGLKKNFLQVASVIVDASTAEVVAIVGDRDPTRRGFNRAIDAKRQPGSVLKPVVYLAALEYPQFYNLATPIDDSPLKYEQAGEVWEPKNYSKQNKGSVAFIDGLVKSYNIPTARIALDIGITDVIQRLQDLGARDGLPAYPSIVLGSVAMSPFEVAQIYEPLANGGYRMPLRVIRSITDAQDEPLNRYPMESVKVISDGPHYLIIKAMQETVKRGTAAKLKQKIPSDLMVAGKTGTTDDYRDSWFAGFSGNYLNVVWVGNDANKKIGLSGSNGAMRVWMDIMKDLPLKPLTIPQPESITEVDVSLETGLLVDANCNSHYKTVKLPFLLGSEPTSYSTCYEQQQVDLESFDGLNFPSLIEEGTNDLWYNIGN